MTFMTACPAYKVTTETLCQFADVGGERKPFYFDKEIVWILETESQVLMCHGGHTLDERGTFNDYYGFKTSIESAKRHAKHLAEIFSVSKESSLEIKVVTTEFLRPAIETAENSKYNKTKAENYREEYTYISTDWRKETIVDGEKRFMPLEQVELGRSTTFSTKDSR